MNGLRNPAFYLGPDGKRVVETRYKPAEHTEEEIECVKNYLTLIFEDDEFKKHVRLRQKTIHVDQ